MFEFLEYYLYNEPVTVGLFSCHNIIIELFDQVELQSIMEVTRTFKVQIKLHFYAVRK